MEAAHLPLLMNYLMRDLNRLENGACLHCGEDDKKTVLNVANKSQNTIDDEKKFAVTLNVSQFHPEELSVQLDGRELTVEGKQEQSTDDCYINRSFIRKWILPENVDLDSLRSQLDDKGHLCIEAPKHVDSGSQKKKIPISSPPSINHK
ncbi:Hsp20/alpha crystallin family protein [Dictyocaulus viviparus]|uniref:Hsp20/alpha crystallin family protein n=1 Tax=Dictyocaulus viviparus TaxID=29172 RepID=A0A0D8XT25_DICVI|nr:Hsp20/alpha crystallin family protein [Dictyocaulus viviparus]